MTHAQLILSIAMHSKINHMKKLNKKKIIIIKVRKDDEVFMIKNIYDLSVDS